jgi:hypothetical protein
MRDIEVEFDADTNEYVVIDNDREEWLATFRNVRDAESFADYKMADC